MKTRETAQQMTDEMKGEIPIGLFCLTQCVDGLPQLYKVLVDERSQREREREKREERRTKGSPLLSLVMRFSTKMSFAATARRYPSSIRCLRNGSSLKVVAVMGMAHMDGIEKRFPPPTFFRIGFLFRFLANAPGEGGFPKFYV